MLNAVFILARRAIIYGTVLAVVLRVVLTAGVVLLLVAAGVVLKGVPDPVGAERAASISRDSIAAAVNMR